MARGADAPEESLSSGQYVALASFRYELRKFLAFSEAAAHAAGLPAQQHQALLAIAGHQGGEAPTVRVLADRLLIAPHTAAELVNRMTEAGLLIKTPSARDRRCVQLTMTAAAEAVLARLSAVHLQELKALEPALIDTLARLGRNSR